MSAESRTILNVLQGVAVIFNLSCSRGFGSRVCLGVEAYELLPFHCCMQTTSSLANHDSLMDLC